MTQPAVEFRPVETTLHRVATVHRERIERKAAEAAKRLARLGAPAPVVTFGPTVEVVETDELSGLKWTWTAFETVTVTGVEASFSGWQPVAALDFTVLDGEAFVSKFPAVHEVEVPETFRHTDAACDHCGLRRDRNVTVLFRSDDETEWKRVGTSCILDFIGVDPANVLNLRASVLDDDDEDDWERAPRDVWEPTVESFLRVAVEVTRVVGFVPSTVDDYRATPTKGFAYDVARGRFSGRELREALGPDFDFHSDEVTAKVEAIVAWVNGQSGSDFIESAQQALRAPAVHRRTVGILAALPHTYDKALARKAEREAEVEAGKASEFVGTVGERLAVEVSVIRVMSFDGLYGVSKLVVGLTDEGDKVSTLGSGRDLFSVEVGDRVEWRGTISEHRDDERWGKETRFKRVKLLPPRTDLDGTKVAKVLDWVTTERDRGYEDTVTGQVTKVTKRDDRWTYEVDGARGWRYGHELAAASSGPAESTDPDDEEVPPPPIHRLRRL